MTQSISSREKVAERLAVSVRMLIRYESRGLVRALDGETGVEVYGWIQNLAGELRAALEPEPAPDDDA